MDSSDFEASTLADPSGNSNSAEPPAIVKENLIEIIEEDRAVPSGKPCVSCGGTIESSDHFCPRCGAESVFVIENDDQAGLRESGAIHRPTEKEQETDPALRRVLDCESCGSQITIDPDQRSYQCAFCDAAYVVEHDQDAKTAGIQSDRQRPEFVIGFSVTRDQASTLFENWINAASWTRPKDLKHAQLVEKIQGIYVPFWAFSMLAESQWSAQIGEYWYRTETYTTRDANGKTVTRTRQVRETEWWPLSGRHHKYYNGYLVSGSQGLSQKLADQIMPFNLPALKRFEPYYLAGWLCEEYSVEREQALQQTKSVFYQREQKGVASFLPGDTHSSLDISTHFSQISSDLCLLPIYLLTYSYKDKLFRCIINGQTGKVGGDKPYTFGRIGVVLGVIALVILIIALLVLLASSFTGIFQ